MKGHEIVTFENGRASLKDPISGQAMHSSIGPWDEARLLYIEQSRLSDRIMDPDPSPLVLYDVGLGLAANSVAAIDCLGECRLSGRPCRAVRLISFEWDLGGLRMALDHLERFSFLIPHERALRALLADGCWRDPEQDLEWTVIAGDYLQASFSDLSPPEIVFYDFYSPGKYPHLWGMDAFGKLRAACRTRAERGAPTWLFTYSVSTAARAAMLLSGFHVGLGVRTPHKEQSTAACSIAGRLERPLDPSWFEHFKRSARPFPVDLPESEHASAREKIRAACRITATQLSPGPAGHTE